MNLTTPRAAGNITGAPFITLVNADGFAVPDCERHTPVPDPDPTEPADWPAWTDNWHWEPTELAVTYDDEAAALGALEDLPWPDDDAPDADPHIAFPGLAPLADRPGLPALCGGSPEPYVPTEEDWTDYRASCADVEARDAARRAEDTRAPLWGYE